MLKCWIRAQECCDGDDEKNQDLLRTMKADDLLKEIRPIYNQKFITRLYVYSGVNLAPTERYLAGMCVCGNVCVYVCMCVCMCVMYVWMYVYVYVCVYVCM